MKCIEEMNGKSKVPDDASAEDLLRFLEEAIEKNSGNEKSSQTSDEAIYPRHNKVQPHRSKEKSNTARKALIGVSIASVLVTIILISGPKGVAVTHLGEPNSIINELRETFQGRSFWIGQKAFIERRILKLENQPIEDADLAKEMRELDRELQAETEQRYREHPDLRPSEAEMRAGSLRDEADKIEDLALTKELDQMRLEELKELRAMLSLINSRLDQ